MLWSARLQFEHISSAYGGLKHAYVAGLLFPLSTIMVATCLPDWGCPHSQAAGGQLGCPVSGTATGGLACGCWEGSLPGSTSSAPGLEPTGEEELCALEVGSLYRTAAPRLPRSKQQVCQHWQ